MLLPDVFGCFKIGDCTGYLEDAGVGAGGEAEAVGDHFEESVAGGVGFAELLDESGRHLGVAVYLGPFETIKLEIAAGFDPCGDCSGRFAVSPVCEVAVSHCRYFNMQIDTVEQWAGDAGAVPVDHDRGA